MRILRGIDGIFFEGEEALHYHGPLGDIAQLPGDFNWNGWFNFVDPSAELAENIRAVDKGSRGLNDSGWTEESDLDVSIRYVYH